MLSLQGSMLRKQITRRPGTSPREHGSLSRPGKIKPKCKVRFSWLMGVSRGLVARSGSELHRAVRRQLRTLPMAVG